jgi:nitroreductase
MGFEEYFRFEGQTELRQYVNFLMGMAPSGIHRAYLVDPGRLDFARKKAPSTIVGVQLAASVTAAIAVKLLLGRGGVKAAPYHHHYDAYLGRLAETRLRWGNAGPLQQMKCRAVTQAFESLSRQPAKPEPVYPATVMEEIIAIARWTPSGDNSQPWRFQPVDENRLTVYIENDSADNIYEYRDGQPTLLSAGMLLASLRIAASAFSRTMQWNEAGKRGKVHQIDVTFIPDASIAPDPLTSFVPLRSVDRRPYRLRPLSGAKKELLEAALGNDLEITWYETIRDRMKIAGLNAAATDIRLQIPETFAIHKQVIDWRRRQSPTGIPAAALGLDRSTLTIMRWAMQSWERLDRFNRRAGTFPARLQMDYLPGVFCAAHFSIKLKSQATPELQVTQLLEAGESLQNFWLMATKLGLVMQPSLAPLAFAYLGGTGKSFTVNQRMQTAGEALARQCSGLFPGRLETIFLGRIGQARSSGSACRSTRRDFDALIEKP